MQASTRVGTIVLSANNTFTASEKRYIDLDRRIKPHKNFMHRFNLPATRFGCTDYTQADVCADDDQELKNPMLLEDVTNANACGGIDLRESLTATKAVFGRTAYFRVTPAYPLDFFDAIRLAMLSTKNAGRSVSAGTP
jgi:hypothetical protein